MDDNGIKLKINRAVRRVAAKTESETKEHYHEGVIADEPLAKNKWRSAGKWILIIWMGLLPMMIWPYTSSPVETGKIMITMLAVFAGMLCWGMTILDEKRLTFRRSVLWLPLVAWCLATVISTLFSGVPYQSIFGYLSQPDSLYATVLYAGLALLCSVFFDRGDIKKIGGAFLFGSLIAMAGGLLSLLMGTRILPWNFAANPGFNPIGSPFVWGMIATLVLAVVSEIPMRRISQKGRILAVVAALLAAASLFALNMQIVWGIFAFAMALAAALNFLNNRRSLFHMLALTVGVGMVFAAPYIPFGRAVPLEVRPGMTMSADIAGRAVLSLRSIAGFGPGMYSVAYSLYRPAETNMTLAWNILFNHGYNFWLTAIVSGGVILSAAFLYLFIQLVRWMVRSREAEDERVMIIIAGTLLASLFIYPANFVLFALLFAAAALGSAVLASHERSIAIDELGGRARASVFLLVVAVLIVAVTAFVFAGKKYVASLYYYRAVVAAAADPDKASAPLMRAIAWDGGGNDEYWRARSQLLVAQLKREAGKEGGGNQATVQQFAISAIDAAQQATVRNEMSPLNWNNLASVYEELSPVAGGAETFALANYQKVKELDPVNPQSYVNSARVHFASAQQKKAAGAPSEEIEKSLDDAQGDLQRALELKKDYGVAHFAYMQILLGRGRTDEITGRVDLLRSLDPFDPALAYEIGIFAFQNNLMEIAQAEFERAVGLKEDYANARFYLSLIYEAQGKRDEAIAQLERVKELNPDNVMINEMIEKARAGQPIIASPPPAPDETED